MPFLFAGCVRFQNKGYIRVLSLFTVDGVPEILYDSLR